ncbi:MAG TPA: GFA family protein [Alphaproteobacteria bacterium]|nr:GFA family protein [Alphaproteobacteria bacterium]
MSKEKPDVRAKGRCLCGGVRYEIRGPIRDVVACHCSQCRRTSGHYMAATAAKRADFTLTRQDGLKWYQSSKAARRGFCGNCGAVLFWEGQGKDYISISAGTLDVPTGIKIVQHIYTADKSDYYALDDGLPQSSGHGPLVPIPSR